MSEQIVWDSFDSVLAKKVVILHSQLEVAMKALNRFANMAYGYYENIPDVLAARDALAEIAKMGGSNE